MQFILVGAAPAIAITTGMARDKTKSLQRRHIPKQRRTAHLALVGQTLCARVALAGFFIVKVRRQDQNDFGARFKPLTLAAQINAMLLIIPPAFSEMGRLRIND